MANFKKEIFKESFFKATSIMLSALINDLLSINASARPWLFF